VDHERVDWQNRAQFLGIAPRQMRHILVNHARAAARGTGWRRAPPAA
jgi:hypothetical protein